MKNNDKIYYKTQVIEVRGKNKVLSLFDEQVNLRLVTNHTKIYNLVEAYVMESKPETESKRYCPNVLRDEKSELCGRQFHISTLENTYLYRRE